MTAYIVVATVVTLLIPVLDAQSYVVPEEIKRQIKASQDDVNKIIDYTRGTGRHATYNRLAELGDTFGSRLTGSQALEESIDYILQNLTQEGFSNTHGENVTVPKWTRGDEWATLIVPGRYNYKGYNQSLPLMALGYSVGIDTVAEIVVVKSFDDLDRLDNATVSGKIVVYNSAWQGSYGPTVQYRREGAIRAAEKGAVAALIRSVTDFSIASPHTGTQQKGVSIPGACITVEDAEMLQRMHDRGWKVTIHLHLEAKNEEDTISRNVVSEIVGKDFPDSVVIFGGHIDTWDVTHGSMDDGGGVMIAWQHRFVNQCKDGDQPSAKAAVCTNCMTALSAIKALGIRPRRTIRLVLWTAEEQGLIGGKEYYNAHQNESGNVSLIIESDYGAFKPRGVGFSGSNAALGIMEEILITMLSGLNLTSVQPDAGSSSDTADWVDAGVPGVELFSYNENYFYWHHTFGDAMTVLDADDLDLCTILWATVALTVANLDDILPRSGEYPIVTTTENNISAGSCVLSHSWQLMIVLQAAVVTVFISFLKPVY